MNAQRHRDVTRLCRLVMAFVLCAFYTHVATAGQPRIFAWGDNSSNQTNVPPNLTNIIAIAAGYYHGLALRSNGTVISWGDNTQGQTNNQSSLTNVSAIDAGAYHSLALRSNSTVYAWGLNNSGQANVPAGLTNVIQISAGANHSMALRSNGTVIAWGNNATGQTNVPPNLTNVIAISAGDAHCLALRANGTVIGWGDNASGQTNVPAYVTNIMAIAAGYHHNLALRSNGTVVAWGISLWGETNVPAGLSNVVAIAAGYQHSTALKSDGTVVEWGQDFNGVGDVPIGLNSVTAIATAYDFDIALSTAGLCPPGFPDNFECRQVFVLVASVSTTGATHEPGEPLHGGVLCSNSVWFTWTAPASGGAVFEVLANSEFASPILAVYTGTQLASLTNVAFNFAPFSGSGTPLNHARVAFTAVQGQTYQLAVDGVPTPGFESQGDLTNRLTLTGPPLNDLFQNAISVNGVYYEITNGSFVGASREPNEPTHGTTLGQSLWWNWTAPTNLNVSAVPVRLTADAVSFPPVIGIYTGSSLATLTSVTSTQSADGMTRAATFSAAPGTTYRIALVGSQNDTNSVLPLTGNYRFRLNTRALALSILNLATNTTPTQAVTFSATARVENVGSASNVQMRVRTLVVPGISMRGNSVSSITDTSVVQGSWTLLPLSPGQNTNVPISGIVPAPSGVTPGTSSAEGFGVYAELQEQVGTTNWSAVDQAQVLYGIWPNLDGLPGPGGGVIRLDPGYVGTSAFNPLASVTVLGPDNLIEGNSANYQGQARYANNFLFNFSNTLWVASRFSITTNGVFKTGGVTSNSVVTVTARFSNNGFLSDAPTNVTVINLPPPFLTRLRAINGNFTMQIQGVSNRLHVIESTTNLSPPIVWQFLSTNALGPTGLLNFTNPVGSTPRRFFRAREAE